MRSPVPSHVSRISTMHFFKNNALVRFLFSNDKRTRISKPITTSGYEALESRRVLASIYLNPTSGELFISGGDGNDVGALVASGDQVEASVTGAASQTFDASDVTKVFFIGNAGNDTLTNSTNIQSSFFGGNGNDTLTGGSNDDSLNGGAGADDLFGGSGDDQLIGSSGNDELRGGDGNDDIFGSSGVNTIYGDAGDDVLFGGDQVDTIFGGDGIDQLYGLGGDDFLDAGDGGVVGSAGIGQADLVLGLGGNDTITGGTGLNVLWGGDGNDIITGGDSAENRLHGQAGRDTLTGGDGFDFIRGLEGENTIDGKAGNDFIIAGLGDENLDGGAGNDIVRFTGNYSSYRINENTAGVLTVRDLRDQFSQGDNDTVNAETFEFADDTRAAAISSVAQLVVRPIVVSNNNGSNRAAFFGDAETQAQIEALIDDIYAQANLDVIFEEAVDYRNTFANTGNTSGTRPSSHLETIVDRGDDAGVGSSNANVIDAYFVERAPGFRDVGENTANGLAFVNSSGTAIHVGDNLLGFQSGLEVIAGVVAHELAHNLGLLHVDAASNLLNSGSSVASNGNYFLTTGQVNTILNSSLTTDVSSGGIAVSGGSNSSSSGSNSSSSGSGSASTSGLSATLAGDGTVTVVEFGQGHENDLNNGYGHDDGCSCPACVQLFG